MSAVPRVSSSQIALVRQNHANPCVSIVRENMQVSQIDRLPDDELIGQVSCVKH